MVSKVFEPLNSTVLFCLLVYIGAHKVHIGTVWPYKFQVQDTSHEMRTSLRVKLYLCSGRSIRISARICGFVLCLVIFCFAAMTIVSEKVTSKNIFSMPPHVNWVR